MLADDTRIAIPIFTAGNVFAGHVVPRPEGFQAFTGGGRDLGMWNNPIAVGRALVAFYGKPVG